MGVHPLALHSTPVDHRSRSAKDPFDLAIRRKREPVTRRTGDQKMPINFTIAKLIKFAAQPVYSGRRPLLGTISGPAALSPSID